MTSRAAGPDEFAAFLAARPSGRSHWQVTLHAGDTLRGRASTTLPIVVLIAAEPGPTLLLTGGVHGNEYEGPAALMALAADRKLSLRRGRLIIAPALNPAALAARARRSPQDGLDLNRSFPGDPAGPMTHALAAFVARVLVPAADAVVDVHAGGEDSLIVPSVMLHFLPDAELMRTTLELGLAFGAPATLVYDEVNPGLFDTFVESSGRPFVCCEMGGAGMLTRESLAFTDAGVRRVLAAMGLTVEVAAGPFLGWGGWEQPRVLVAPDDSALPRAPAAGFLRPLVEIGERVRPDTPVGRLHDPEAPWSEPRTIAAGLDGTVYSRHTGGQVREGETVAIVAAEIAANVAASPRQLLDTLMRIAPASRRRAQGVPA